MEKFLFKFYSLLTNISGKEMVSCTMKRPHFGEEDEGDRENYENE